MLFMLKPSDFAFVIDVHEPGLSEGLSQRDCYVNVLRDAMAADGGNA